MSSLPDCELVEMGNTDECKCVWQLTGSQTPKGDDGRDEEPSILDGDLAFSGPVPQTESTQIIVNSCASRKMEEKEEKNPLLWDSKRGTRPGKGKFLASTDFSG